MSDNAKSSDDINPEFKKVLSDLLRDLIGTFPELNSNLHEDLVKIETSESLINVFEYCKKIFPERFFDILYQNNEIWEKEDVNTNFLPDLDFATLMTDTNVSDKTKETIWKYLQLILLSITSSLNTGESFGDTAKLFEAIDEEEFKKKLEDTVGQMHDMFGGLGKESKDDDDGSNNDNGSNINLDNLPNPEELHDHITGMLDGKLGSLAREIAEETAKNLDIDMENSENIGDVFKKLFQNPGKLMNLVKNVGGKLDEKIKSGDIKESELLEEATEIMNKMKNMPGMPGMDNIQDLLKNMGMSGGQTKNFNQSAFNSHMEKQMKMAKMKERMRSKQTSSNQTSSNQTSSNQPSSNKWTDGSSMNKTTLEEAQKLSDESAKLLMEEEDLNQTRLLKKKQKKKKKRKKKEKGK